MVFDRYINKTLINMQMELVSHIFITAIKSRKYDNGCPRVGISDIGQRKFIQFQDFLLRHQIDIGMFKFDMNVTMTLEFKA